MPPRVYIETSIVSYLVARPSADPALAADQRRTREWWAANHGVADLYTSELVITEAKLGDRVMAAERVRHLSRMNVLRSTPEATALADALVERGPLPARAHNDALHIALAATYGIEYLLTWNCKHIANAQMRPTIERICEAHRVAVPVLCTPSHFTGR
ncbi:MAG TPA: type II toxin-antitoxin system VapC family toxin [Longimicrobium sp.]|nr:type II toxin-antitoxin system VapC family toxin [Longimicrobium sp.]